ncbi:MAG: hypothetical protein K6G17_01825 [Oscillospiraceae bacterium]|nr:hypothetical protein [Oscillospiraceae bacterium]
MHNASISPKVEKPDPNAGAYEAVTAEMSGISLDINSVYDGGLSFELKDGGKAVMTMDGKDYNLRWKLDGEDLTIIASDTELTGTLSDGVMVLDMGSGITVTLVRGN